MSSGEAEPQADATPPAPVPAGPVGVKVKRRAVMVDGKLVDMPEQDQIGDGRPKE